MARYKIITIGDEILKSRARDVTKFDDRIDKLVANMVETTLEEDGVGLAAPQIGISKRVIIVLIEEEDQFIPLINPEILETKGEVLGQEGCLSVPGKIGLVNRFDWIKVSYQTTKGEKTTLEAKDMLARIIQHELDHLNGILFVDRAESIEDIK